MPPCRSRQCAFALLVLGTALMLAQATGQAQASVQLYACKKIILQGGGYFGDSVTPRDCGTRFSTQDAYIALVIQLRSVGVPTDIGAQLLDPSDSPLWAGRTSVNPDGGVTYESVWFYAVLPVAADLRALAAENRQLAQAALRFPGKPARERPGEWKFNVSVNRGQPHILKFILEAVPGAPASPTPVPSPTSSP